MIINNNAAAIVIIIIRLRELGRILNTLAIYCYIYPSCIVDLDKLCMCRFNYSCPFSYQGQSQLRKNFKQSEKIKINELKLLSNTTTFSYTFSSMELSCPACTV